MYVRVGSCVRGVASVRVVSCVRGVASVRVVSCVRGVASVCEGGELCERCS